MKSVKISLASTDLDLIGIKNLQTKNLKTNLSSKEKKAEGFLTAEYTMTYLKKNKSKIPCSNLKKGRCSCLRISYYQRVMQGTRSIRAIGCKI